MKILKLNLFLFIIYCMTAALYSAPIDLELGARAGAMGGGFTALADDAYSNSWNPAGLAGLRSGEVSFSHVLMPEFAEINIDYLTFSNRMKNNGFGISWLNVGSKLKEKDEATKIEKTNSLTENNFTIAYGMKLSEKIRLGLSLKRLTIDSNIGGGAGLGFDFGSLWQLNRVFSFALVFKNIATDLRNESFPMLYRLGLGSRLLNDKLRLGLDVDTKYDINDQKGISPRIHAGLEYLPFGFFVIRGGYDNGNITGGIGIIYSNWNLNYALQMTQTIGDNHRMSLGYAFNQSKQAEDTTDSAPAQKGRMPVDKRKKLLNKAESNIKDKDYEKAKEQADEVLKYFPEDSRALELKKASEEGIAGQQMEEIREMFKKGTEYFKLKKYKKAESYFNDILEKKPDHEPSKEMLQRIQDARSSEK